MKVQLSRTKQAMGLFHLS